MDEGKNPVPLERSRRGDQGSSKIGPAGKNSGGRTSLLVRRDSQGKRGPQVGQKEKTIQSQDRSNEKKNAECEERRRKGMELSSKKICLWGGEKPGKELKKKQVRTVR